MRNEEVVVLGKWTEEVLNAVLSDSSLIKDKGTRVDFLSRRFIGTEYREATLIGDLNTPEMFVVNLEGVDCFTFIEYIEAMRLSGGYDEFPANLRRIRYRSGTVAFEKRNHFFTDWKIYNTENIDDATEVVRGNKAKQVMKLLNKKNGESLFLPGIPICEREIQYIPAEDISGNVVDKLKTGDYAGIYSEDKGLDVSHVGIIIKDGATTLLRHASSLPEIRKVIDQDFAEYTSTRPGIIVLRPK